MVTYEYVGAFISRYKLEQAIACIRRTPLKCAVMNPHVTFEYKPLHVDVELFGRYIDVRIVGYGCDGKNEGLAVEVFSEMPELKQKIERIPVPHITLSTSADGKAVNTRYLTFYDVPPIAIAGTYGGFSYSDRNVHLRSTGNAIFL